MDLDAQPRGAELGRGRFFEREAGRRPERVADERFHLPLLLWFRALRTLEWADN
jgi:hypothetical protein